ncbi:MAG: hypothetical protein ACXIU8_10455 [Alkalilacustris sp.]
MKAVLLLAATLLFVTSPWFTSGFGGFDPDLFPIPQSRPPVQPAGYAFAIWGLIYVWLLAHAAFGLWSRAQDPGWDGERWWLIASLVVGASWIAVANANAPAATVLIWVMLAGALGALWVGPRGSDRPERWLGQAPVAVYAGWLTAASWVAVGFMLGGYGVMSEAWSAAVALSLAAAMAVAVQRRLPRAPEYGWTVIWALVAVAIANTTTAWQIAGLAIVAIAVMAWTLARNATLPHGTQP